MYRFKYAFWGRGKDGCMGEFTIGVFSRSWSAGLRDARVYAEGLGYEINRRIGSECEALPRCAALYSL